jgi:hypothetical protein
MSKGVLSLCNVCVRGTHVRPASPLRIGSAPDFIGLVAGRPDGRRQFGDPIDWKIT